MPTGHGYLDTVIWLDLISDNKAEHQDALEIKNRVSAKGLTIVIPQTIMGEAVSIILRNHSSDTREIGRKTEMLCSEMLYFIEPDKCLPSVEVALLEHMKYFVDICKLEPNDALILAHVMNDPESEIFVTSDTKVLTTPEIYQYEESLRDGGKRNRRLAITDSP